MASGGEVTVDVPMAKVTAAITLKVKFTGMTRATVRRWLGTKLITLGALVIGCEVEIEAVNNGRPVVGS